MVLYITRLRITHHEYNKLRIVDLYSLHRIVYDLFDEQRDQRQKQSSIASGIQWVEGSKTSLCNEILILSNRPVKQDSAAKYTDLNTCVIPENFFIHHLYRFEVILNPCRRESHSRKLVPIRQPEQIIEWFRARTEVCCGFSTLEQPIYVESFHLEKFFAKKDITLHRVKLSGYLTVLDQIKFKATIAKGIGRGRAFGCGLLQVLPILELPPYLKGV